MNTCIIHFKEILDQDLDEKDLKEALRENIDRLIPSTS